MNELRNNLKSSWTVTFAISFVFAVIALYFVPNWINEGEGLLSLLVTAVSIILPLRFFWDWINDGKINNKF